MSRFSFRDTEIPGDDLAGFLQSINAASSTVDAVASRDQQNATGVPGIVLLIDNRPCAVLGYNLESDETISISEPAVLLNASHCVYPALCDQLLNQISSRAVEQGAQRLHFLQQNAETASMFVTLLPKHGFVPATEIQRWELAVAVDSSRTPSEDTESTRFGFAGLTIRQSRGASDANPDMMSKQPAERCALHHDDFTAADVGEDRELQRALSEILTCSEDLTGQPLPSATWLLSRWQQMSASVWLCRIDHRIAGLMTLGIHPAPSTESVADLVESESRINIEYIGVVPEFRRRRIASLMIQRIPMLVNQKWHSPANSSMPSIVRIVAYSDVANCPAGCLYQQCGFTPYGRMRLWSCDLNRALLRTEISIPGAPRE